MAFLALNGGEKQRKKEFIKWPVFDEREVKAVTDVVNSGNWWRFAFGEGVNNEEKKEGDNRAQVVLFQEEFAKYQQADYGLTCANGTAALEISLKALGIGAGDEVIVPSYTFVSTATCVLQVNATPIFVDIDEDTYNIDPARIEEAITERTRAIIPVHFFGQPANMDAILEIAKKHNLYVIEDSSHAHGSEWDGKRVGALGDVGTFSFQASKNLTAGEGGIILSNNKKLIQTCDSLVWLGREEGRPWYEFHRLGWNYRITEFQGAILRTQMQRLDAQIMKRAENVKYFKERMQEIEAIRPVKVLDKVTRHSNHIIALKYDPKVWGVSKEKLREALIAEGICVTIDYAFPLYKNPLFINKNFGKSFEEVDKHYPTNKNIDYLAFEKTNPVAERACREQALWLEQRMFLGEKEDIDDIVAAFLKIQDHIQELRD